ncbi:hypothetical protein PFLUOLIPICF7_00840 [Pseudomonas simiae]|uniref:Uncharacterized protein n=1 Tax=Pseudomonas simiae TaxID=321846 RepID=U1TAC0_9PSED|nr:hypothetical protein PFLUOLIPICF7_00840 [Pseudomonas simiae]ERH61135.1 hypothetical protein O204_15980 [Pseudomonas simiae]TKK00725.1 hypothetical protein PflCFBP13514_23965 [Pseudomonas fluorescens]
MGILIRRGPAGAQVRAIEGMDQRRNAVSGGRACRQWNKAQNARSDGSVAVCVSEEPSMRESQC